VVSFVALGKRFSFTSLYSSAWFVIVPDSPHCAVRDLAIPQHPKHVLAVAVAVTVANC
jgi:hypothetical protein